MTTEPTTTILSVKTLLGLATPFAAVGVSYLPQLVAWMQITSLAIGSLIGLFTLWNLWRDSSKRSKRK